MHALAKLCIQRPVFATMLIMPLVVAGIFTYFSLGVDRFPNLDAPMVTVSVTNQGASPEEVETEITRKIEDAVNSISGLDEINSTSSEGLSTVSISFDLSKNGNVAAEEVQNKINQIVNDLPSSAKTPVVSKMDPDAASILQVAVSAPRSTRDITLIADKLVKQKMENCVGVGQVKIQGGAKREIHVILTPDRLKAYNLTVSDVFSALKIQNMEMPGGVLRAGAQDISVRSSGKITDPADFNSVVITTRNAYPIKVSDVGYAEDSYQEPSTTARLDGIPAVIIAVSKQSGTNTVEVTRIVKERLAQIEGSLPKDVKLQIVDDQSIFVEASIDAIKNHLFEGSLLAALVLYFFLANWRTTVIAAVAIPTSIISAFSLMAVMHYTMNMITMLALTLMVGVVVDDAIIVLENIYRFMEEKGMPPFEASVKATKEIGLAVLATTVSLLAVFVPVGFMGGMSGRFMSAFGFTCAGAVVVSLLVSFTLTPMMCARFVRPSSGKTQQSKDSAFFRSLDGFYTRALKWTMNHRKTIIACCVLVVFSVVPLFMMIGKNFIPKDDQSEFNIIVRLPEGSSLARTTSYAEAVARGVRGMQGVSHVLTIAGGSSTGAANQASISVKLVDIDERSLSADGIAAQAREMFKDHPADAYISVTSGSGVGGGGGEMADVQYYLQGPDITKLSEYSERLVAEAKKIPGIGDVESSLRTGKPELRLEIDRARAADLGVSVQDVQQAVNMLITGQVAGTFNTGDDQYDVRVRAEESYRGSATGLEKLTVASIKNGSVGLDQLVQQRTGSGPSSVKRLNRQRIVSISGNLLPGGSQSAVVSRLDQLIRELNLGTDYKGGATGMTGELGKTGYYFAIACALAFIFMYIALAAQFESFIHPITILITLPLAVPFGILSMLVTGQSINIMSGLGLLLLFGIVKKNAILQVDHMNGLRAQGMNRSEAIIQANRDRLRPILMTTLALVFGMVPLLLSRGAGATTNHSIGFMVAGGQTLCLLLTLLAVPVFYSLWEDLADWVKSVWATWANRRTAGAATVLSIILLVIAHAHAQTPTAAPQVTGSQSVRLMPLKEIKFNPRIGIRSENRIQLNEVIERVLANDPELAISRITVDGAGHNVKAAQGYYDPKIGLTADRTRTVTPIASLIGGSDSGKLTSNILSLNPQIIGFSPWLGSSYSLTFSGSKQLSDSTFNTLNPQYPSTMTLNLTQPLWQGLLFDSGRHELLVARKTHDLSLEGMRQKVIERVTLAVQYFWELAYALQNLQVQNEAVKLAVEQYESNRRQAEQGLLAPIELVAAQTQVATFQKGVAAAQQVLTTAENNLKQMICSDRRDPLWDAALIPGTQPDPNASTPTLAEAMEIALASRPELSESSINIAINQLDTRFYKEQVKPRIDAYGTFSASGLAGIPQALNPIFGLPAGKVPEILIGGAGKSLSNIWAGNFPGVKLGVQISLPLRNRTAQANAARSAAEGNRLQIVKKQVEMLVVADVRNALEQVNSARRKYDAAVTARSAAQEQYESEQRQFQAGTSIVFLVFQRQTSFITARADEIRARTDLAEAIANLDRAMARTLEVHQIKIK